MVQLLLSIIYLSFISLGLPDGLLGAAWPSMYPQFGVAISHAGIISMIIAVGTVISSLMSNQLTLKLGTGKVTALSVATTAAALLGFSCSSQFWMLCLWAIPYGLGAGSVDACLNNYVAIHYSSRHMSWLHCMWGIGASTGPVVMGAVLERGMSWNIGYRGIGWLQIILMAALLLSLPLWKERRCDNGEAGGKGMSLRKTLHIPGAKQIMIAFFCYSAVEQTTALWASSYLTLYKGVSENTAAFFASMFFIGITAGRALNGFLTMKFSDTQLIRMGHAVILVGVAAMLIPLGTAVSLAGLIIIGLGCAPIYPCIIHSTPAHFGESNSQSLIGLQMAAAYVGTCLTPPLFGLLGQYISISLLPLYLLLFLAMMFVMHELMLRKLK